jgi:serine/threonine-protein kinase
MPALARGSRLNEVVPKITDFGLAKLISNDPEATAGGGTETGAVLGTPQYMAPEQATGKSKEVGPAADVYALGVILYEALVGRPPFRGETPLDTLEQVRNQEPVPPRRLLPKLPRDLETICLKCLHKEPGRRYAGAGALAEDLRHFLADRPIQGRPVQWWERVRKWARHRPAAAALLAVSGAAALALLLIVWAYNSRLRQANEDLTTALTRADEQRREANINFRLAREGIDEFATKVSQDQRLRAHDLEALRKQLLQSAVRFYEKFVNQRPGDAGASAERGRAYQRLALVTKELGLKYRAITLYRQAQAIFEELLRDHPDTWAYQGDLAAIHLALAELFETIGRTAEAEKSSQAALVIFKQLRARQPGDPSYQNGLAAVHNNLGIVYKNTNRIAAAETAYQTALSLRKPLVKTYPRVADYQQSLAGTYVNLGVLCGQAGRKTEAEKAFKEARTIFRQLAKTHPQVPKYQEELAGSNHSLGILYLGSGRQREAEVAYRAALDIRKKIAEAHPQIPDYRHWLAATYGSLGDMYYRTARYEQAGTAFEKGLAIEKQLVAAYPEVVEYRIGLSISFGYLGYLLEKTGKPQAALGWFDRAIKGFTKILQKEPRLAQAKLNLAEAYEGRANALTRLGQAAQAISQWDRAIEFSAGPKRDRLRLIRALALARLGRYTLAVAEADALAANRSLPGTTLYDLACVEALAAAAATPTSGTKGLADQYAARAVSLLARARDTGLFNNPAQRDQLKKDRDLDSLRARKDFHELVHAINQEK